VLSGLPVKILKAKPVAKPEFDFENSKPVSLFDSPLGSLANVAMPPLVQMHAAKIKQANAEMYEDGEPREAGLWR